MRIILFIYNVSNKNRGLTATLKQRDMKNLSYVFYLLLVCVMTSCYTKPKVKKLMTESHQKGWVDGATRVYNVTVLDSIYDNKNNYQTDSVRFLKTLNAL